MKTKFIFVLSLVFYGFLSAQKPYDILISEFMPAPAVNRELPNVEYIELYNRSKITINLRGFKIWNGKISTILPDTFWLKAGAYVVIYQRKSGVDFKIKDTIGLSKLVPLSNPNDVFHLTTPRDSVIDVASYDLSFYQGKPESGLALERIYPNSPCNLSAWSPSIDTKNGTPGKENSNFFKDSIDKTPPIIEQYYLISDKKISLTFNKSLNRKQLMSLTQYQILGGINVDSTALLMPTFNKNAELFSASQISKGIAVKSVDTLIAPLFNTIELTIDTALKKETLYKMVIKPITKDCQDSLIPLSIYNSLYLQTSVKPAPNELIINEILVNPESGGGRFVELYNRSKKAFDIKDLQLKDFPKNDVKPISSHFLLLPKQYVVLAEKPAFVVNHYKSDSFKFSIIKNKLPTWNEASGNVRLAIDSLIFDNFTYYKSWHNPLLATTEGVSLERINPDLSSSTASNWQSAAEGSNFGTPAQKNSQFRNLKKDPSVSSPFWLEKNSFSPDNDGFEDALLIRYKLEKSVGVVNVSIFDSNGRFTKALSINELIGAEGTLRWQGERADDTKASVGIYILVIDTVYQNGSTTRQKLPFALTTQF